MSETILSGNSILSHDASGNQTADVAVQSQTETKTPTLSPSPLAFPESGYVGVIAEWAELMSQHYESAKAFFYLDGLTLVGTMISGRVRVRVGSLVTQPRLYTLKIAPSAFFRKSTSTSLATDFIESAIEEANRSKPQPVPGLADRPTWLKILHGVGSGEGLANALQKYYRVVTVFDEYRRFEKKANIDGSILVSMVNELYEKNKYANATKTNQLEVSNAHLGFLSNTTEETFQKLVNADEMEDIGHLNRYFLVTSDTDKRIALPTDPDETELAPIRAKLASYLHALPELDEHGKAEIDIFISLSPEAERLWTDWYNALERSSETARLDIIGLRLIGLLAFTSGQTTADVELVRRVIDILDYQQRVRVAFKPIRGQTLEAKIEETIIAQLKKRGPLTERELSQFTNARRNWGSKKFRQALNDLTAANLIKPEQRRSGSGPVTLVYVLVEEKQTAALATRVQ